ncbi:MAG: flagellar protein FlaG [Planctomycetota bacterium]|jgi:uncharacterized FlaG/YvyC family protein
MAESVNLHNLQATAPRAAEAAARVDRSARRVAESAAEAPPAEAKDTVSEGLMAAVRELHHEEEAPRPEKDPTEAQREELRDAFTGVNDIMSHFSKSIRFETFEDSGELYAQVIDSATSEVIKSIPSEEALSMMSRIHNALGMLVDTNG